MGVDEAIDEWKNPIQACVFNARLYHAHLKWL